MGAEPPLEEQTQPEGGGRCLGGKQYKIPVNKLDVMTKGIYLFFISGSCHYKMSILLNTVCAVCVNIQVGEEVEAQYVSLEDEEQLTEAHVAALHDNGNKSKSTKHSRTLLLYVLLTIKCKCCLYSVNIQQITEFSSETHDAVTSMVAMAPGTVAVVQQVNHIISFL